MPVALPVSLGGVLSALPDPASIDDHIVVVGVTIDPNGAEGEAVDPHDKSPNRQRTRPAHQPSGGDGYQSQPPGPQDGHTASCLLGVIGTELPDEPSFCRDPGA